MTRPAISVQLAREKPQIWKGASPLDENPPPESGERPSLRNEKDRQSLVDTLIENRMD